MSDQLKKNPFPTVPAPLPHSPVASTVLILHFTNPRRKAKKKTFKSKSCSNTKRRLWTRSNFLCPRGASASGKVSTLRYFASSCSCWIIILRGNPPSWLYIFSLWASGMAWAIPSFPGTGSPWREAGSTWTDYGNFHNCQKPLLPSREKLL